VSYFLTDKVMIQLTPVGAGIWAPFHHWNMAKYFQRSCPKCNGYLGIVVPERKTKLPVKVINGRCLKCGYRLAWVLVLGERLTRQSAYFPLIFSIPLMYNTRQT
jgi:hypothetical protein